MNNILARLEQGEILVTARPRQARHWRWRYDQRQRDAGGRSWVAPAIVSLNEWLEQLWEQSLLADGKAGRLGLLKPKQSELVWRQLLQSEDAALTGMTTAAGLRMVTRAWQTSQAWQLSVASMVAQASTPDATAFGAWAQSYQTRLRERAWTDLASLPTLLMADLQTAAIAAPRRLCWAGFIDPDPLQRRLDEALRAAGCETRHWQPETDAAPARSLAFARDLDEQFTALDTLADWHRQAAPSVFALVLPDMAGGRANPLRQGLLDRLSPAWRHGDASELPVTLAQGPSLSSAGLVHTALTGLRLAEGRLDYRDFSHLLRSPYLGAADSEAHARAHLERRLRQECQRDLSLAELLALKDFPAPLLHQQLEAARQCLRDAGARREPDAWVVWFEALLEGLGWPGRETLQLDEQAALKSWRQCLEQFAATSPVTGKLGLTGALSLLRQMTDEQEFQPGASAAGIQILSPEQAVGQSFDGVWMAAMHSDAWPPPASPDPLLPLALQRQAGLPACSPQAHVARAGRILKSVTAATPELVMSYARAENDRLCSPSPAFDLAPAFRDVEASTTPAIASVERIQWQAELETLSEDPAPGLRADEKVRGGSRLLQLQAVCPARAFFEYRLRAEPLEVPPFGLDAAVRGQVLHQAAENLYSQLHSQNLAPGDEAAEELVVTAVQSALAPWLNARHPFLRVLAEIEQQRLKAQLQELLAFDARRPEFRILATEQAGKVRIGPLQLSLRLDRIDALDTGARLVIDYKTGRRFSTGDWQGERPAEPQLPLYAIAGDVDGIAIMKINADGVKVQGVATTDFGLRGLQTVEKFSGGELDSWQALRSAWQSALAGLASEYADGFAAIDADHPEPAQDQFAPLTRVYATLSEPGR